MTGKLALIVHREAELRQRAGEALAGAGFKVMSAASADEALERIGRFFVPDVLLTSLDGGKVDGEPALAPLRSNPLTRDLPTVILASGDPGERRRSLRMGVTLLVPPPHDEEEIVLTARLALERHRDQKLLSGSIDQLAVVDLLQTLEATLRSGSITLRCDGKTGNLWLRGGRIVDAEIDDGRRGREAVYAITLWDRGTFEADFDPVSVPERITESTSYLLLEAMRRRDEAARREDQPPHAALPDPPPAPPRSTLAVHRAVTLLNVAASYAASHLDPALLERRLESHRAALTARHRLLEHFAVGAGGATAWTAAVDDGIDVEPLVAAVAGWLREFFADMERALPGRFSIQKLQILTEAIQEDLQTLGFYEALGLASTTPEDPS